jgi:hypothetical protein
MGIKQGKSTALRVRMSSHPKQFWEKMKEQMGVEVKRFKGV